jgi:alginate O-acetyltransferase complex protein AlgJ
MTQTLEKPAPAVPPEHRAVRRWTFGRVCAAVVATTFVFGPVAGHLAGSGGQPLENRKPAPAPKPEDGWKALDAVGPWAADRLPGRSRAVRTNAWLDYHLLGEVPIKRNPGGQIVPQVVRGRDGYLYLPDDFTIACSRRGAFEPALRDMLRLAETIRSSGRRVAFSVAPNKSSVATAEVPDVVPDGRCATQAIAEQQRVQDNTSHSLLVNTRARLAAAHRAGGQPYWRADTHWNHAGAAIYAQALAEHLDPGLAARVKVTPERMTRVGDLTGLLGLTSAETGSSATVSAGGSVVPDPSLDQYDPFKVLYGKERWKTTPSTGLIPGRTVLIGDSFTYYALGAVRPLFADGTFLWTGKVSQAELIRAIKDADTVVIQLAERSVGRQHTFTKPAFRKEVAAALR